MFQLSNGKIHSLKKVVAIRYILEKRFFGTTTFEDLKKTSLYFGLYVPLLTFLEKRGTNKDCLWEANLVFHLQIFSSINCKSILKKSSLKCRLCFCGVYNIIFSYNFVAPLTAFTFISLLIFLACFVQYSNCKQHIVITIRQSGRWSKLYRWRWWENRHKNASSSNWQESLQSFLCEYICVFVVIQNRNYIRESEDYSLNFWTNMEWKTTLVATICKPNMEEIS